MTAKLATTNPGVAPEPPSTHALRFDQALRRLATLLPDGSKLDGEQILTLATSTIVELRKELNRQIREAATRGMK